MAVDNWRVGPLADVILRRKGQRGEVLNFLDPQRPKLDSPGYGVEYAYTLHAPGMVVVVILPLL